MDIKEMNMNCGDITISHNNWMATSLSLLAMTVCLGCKGNNKNKLSASSISLVLRKTFIVFLLMFCASFAEAHEVSFDFSASDSDVKITGRVADGWKIYANESSDIGLPFSIDSSSGIQRIVWPSSTSVTENIGDSEMTSYYYDQDFEIVVSFDKLPSGEAIVPITISYGVCSNVCLQETQVFNLTMQDGVFVSASSDSVEIKERAPISLYYIIFLSIIGGFILNFMPCVLPVLGIKIMTLVNSRHNTALLSLATSLGIIASFVFFGVIAILLQSVGEVVGWGFHFQNQNFILFLIFILLLFASNLWGDFEFILPTKISGIAAKQSSNDYLNSILTGVFASILATPCTAPFLSSAVALSLSQGALTIMVAFTSIGVGMALPFLMMVVMPELVHLLPKPGKWMYTLKKFFAMLLIVTALWLLYIISLNIDYVYIMAFVAICVLLRVVLTRLSRIMGIVLITVFVLISFISLNSAEYMPRAYLDFSNSSWREYEPRIKNDALDNGKIVLVNVTAEWCITCKLNEVRVLNDKRMRDYFEQNEVVLLHADFTFNTSEDIKQMLATHNRSGIPLTVVYSKDNPEGTALSELLSIQEVVAAIESR